MARETFRPAGSVAATFRHEEPADASCFADEVVVDFPSASRAFDRMCHAFVGEERSTAIPADLHLSWREARDGAVIPLGVPVRCTCRQCGGRGETWSERCSRCGGTGTEMFRHQVQVSLPAGVSNGDRFCFSVRVRHDPPTRVELRVLVA